MILVDSSVWIEHFRRANAELRDVLETGQVMTHPFIIGELALGHLRPRKAAIEALHGLPQAVAAEEEEVLGFIERQGLFGLGIGYIDAHLLVSARMASAWLWTRDKTLQRVSADLQLAYHGH